MKRLDYAVDYREIDPDMQFIMGTETILHFVQQSSFSRKTKMILNELYETLNPLSEHAFLLLHRIPRQEETVDLTLFEGSGFYQYHEPYWIYHKGGGCIDALAIKERFELSPIYAPFGAEYSGWLGTFSSSTLLGVKRLWQCVHEFASSFTVLGHAIEHNCSITRPEDVIGQMVIPLCVVSLPRLNTVIQENLYDKPESIIQSYKNTESENQAAKILMLVPSPIRATDNYEVEGKWLETHNIFYRTMSCHKTKLNHFDWSPFWNEEQTKIRGRTMAQMFNAGFVFQPISAHLQNYYVVPNSQEKKIALNAADFCDFLPLKNFSAENLECVLQNILNGWRIAESSGPAYSPHNAAVSFQDIQILAKSFFEELLGDQYDHIEKFYVLLPFTSCISIIKFFCSFQVKNQSIQTWEEILDYTPYGEVTRNKIMAISERCIGELETLFEPLRKLRPRILVNKIVDYFTGKKSPTTNAIASLVNEIMASKTTNVEKKMTLYYSGYALEMLFFLEKDHSKTFEATISELACPRKAEMVAMSLLGEYVQTLKAEPLRGFLKNHLEEILHIKQHDLRHWMLHANDPACVQDWLVSFMDRMENLIKAPSSFTQDYLGFIFKRDTMLELIQASTLESPLKSHLNRPWDGRERPVHRPYPVVEFCETLNDEEIKGLFIPLAKMVHRIGYHL